MGSMGRVCKKTWPQLVNPMISVVIPAYNEEKCIASTLNAFLRQQTSQQFEVILVDNNSTDKTAEIVKKYTTKLPLIMLTEKKKGRGAARKAGFAKAKGEIILSTDADTVVPENWIENLTHALTGQKAIAVTGTCKITDCDFFTNFLFNLFQPNVMRFYRLLFGHYWLTGSNFAIYNDVYKKSGEFNDSLNAQEDVDLAFRVSKVGKIYFLSNTPVTCSGRRFQGNLARGILPYFSTFIKYYFFQKKIELHDAR